MYGGRMKRFLRNGVVVVLVMILSSALMANGLNLNGSGSKAIGMGGAFVGLADDFTAIYWNPAGMSQIKKPMLSFFCSDIMPTGTYKLSPYVDAKTETEHYLSPAVGFYKPVSDKVTVGIYVYVPSASGATWDGADLVALTNGKVYEWKSLFGVISISPAIAIQLNEKFSIGASLNVEYGFDKVKRPMLGQYDESLNGWAVGGTLGIMFQPSKKLSFGATYKLPVSVTLSGTVNIPAAASLGLPTSDTGERSADFPMWFGFGVAYKPTDRLTFTADAHFTNWKKMTLIDMQFVNSYWNAAFGEIADFDLEWKDTQQIRFGMEYKVSQSLALRAGFYTDPSPSPKRTQNILLPQISYKFATFGLGYKTSKFLIEGAFEYGFGKERTILPTEVKTNKGRMIGMPGVHQENIPVPNISVTFFL